MLLFKCHQLRQRQKLCVTGWISNSSLPSMCRCLICFFYFCSLHQHDQQDIKAYEHIRPQHWNTTITKLSVLFCYLRFVFVFIILPHLFSAALCSPARKCLTYWLFCVWCFLVFLSLSGVSHMVSRIRCGTWLYRFLIDEFFLTCTLQQGKAATKLNFNPYIY